MMMMMMMMMIVVVMMMMMMMVLINSIKLNFFFLNLKINLSKNNDFEIFFEIIKLIYPIFKSNPTHRLC